MTGLAGLAGTLLRRSRLGNEADFADAGSPRRAHGLGNRFITRGTIGHEMQLDLRVACQGGAETGFQIGCRDSFPSDENPAIGIDADL